jgi:hypothetical protein
MTKNQKIILGVGAIALALYLYKRSISSNKVSDSEALNNWKRNFDSKNLDGIVNSYSPNAILVSTFGDILEGRAKIQEYFVGLFKKDNLMVTYMENPIVTKVDGSTMFTGIYEFSYTENGKKQSVKARYSFIVKDGFITKQHSSEVPKKENDANFSNLTEMPKSCAKVFCPPSTPYCIQEKGRIRCSSKSNATQTGQQILTTIGS